MRAASVSRLLTVVLWCGLCTAIKVPITWEPSDSALREDLFTQQEQQFSNEWAPELTKHKQPKSADERDLPSTTNNPIPVEYFEYTARKPNFAVDVATFHDVPKPRLQYHATPVRPYALDPPPNLGQRAVPNRPIFEPFHTFLDSHDGLTRYIGAPVSTNYEVFHPYKEEEPSLKNLYKDPNLDKVRNDIEKNKNRLQQYEKNAGEANIETDDYTKTPEQTDDELFGQTYKQSDFEEYRPEKRPHYYSPPLKQRLPHNYLNKKLKYPLNQNYIKIKPIHYQPLRNRLNNFRHRQENKYGDERNEYPQLVSHNKQHFAEPPEGYDIYERGKEHFDAHQHDVDTALNKYSTDYGGPSYGKDESIDLTENSARYRNQPQSESKEDDFVPIKLYAQVRKTESIKHLPKEAAFEEAETPEEILNAPRLREAVKSTKAQTIYSEEGYEDKAYDHEGQQKHASSLEGHGGYLKEKENSVGRYKIPFIQHEFEEGDGVKAGNSYSHKEKYENEDGRSEDQDNLEISTNNEDEDDENEYDLDEAGSEKLRSNIADETDSPKALLSLSKDSKKTTISDENDRTSIKTQTEHMTATNKNNNNRDFNISKQTNVSKKQSKRNVSRKKRNVNFEVPNLSLDNTYLTESEIVAISKQKLAPVVNKLKMKYPYYFQTNINKNSPLRYAENLNYVPIKTKGGSEFYDSRSVIECPDIEPEIDPVPKKINNASNDSSEDNEEESDEVSTVNSRKNFIRRKRQSDFSTIKKSPRLRGLGDKIDCFKEKYFGENPLDSPFFIEDTIDDLEPINELQSDIHKITKTNGELIAEPSVFNEIIEQENINASTWNNNPLFNFNQSDSITKIDMITEESTTNVIDISELSPKNYVSHESNVYSDVVQNIQKHLKSSSDQINNKEKIIPLLLSTSPVSSKAPYENIKQFDVYFNKEDVTIQSPMLRVKRSNQFIYEPYKVIRDYQEPDYKKTTTSGNISPLIKQLQASKVVDHTIRTKDEARTLIKVQPVKRNVKEKTYKNIHREDRAKRNEENNSKDFVDVSFDSRRGEPRYELSQLNHKSKYSPVTNTKSITLDEYKLRISPNLNKNIEEVIDESVNKDISEESETMPVLPETQSPRPYFDVSAYIPRVRRPIKQIESLKNVNKQMKRKYNGSLDKLDSIHLQESSSENLPKIITTKQPIKLQPAKKPEVVDTDDDIEYDEYDDEPLTTTTTKKPIIKIKRKIKLKTTTTVAPASVQDYDYPEEEPTTSTTAKTITTTSTKPKVKIVRRFRKPDHQNFNETNSATENISNRPDQKKSKLSLIPKQNPKVLEKTIKTQKSTIITDSKSYGDEDEAQDMQKEQIDAMIGGREKEKEFMDDYDNSNSREGEETKDIRYDERQKNSNSQREGERENDSVNDDEDRGRQEEEVDEEEVDEEEINEGERETIKQNDEEDTSDERRDNNENADSDRPALARQMNDIVLPIVRKRLIFKKTSPAKPESAADRNGQYRQSPEQRTATGRGRPEQLQTYRDKALPEDVNRLADVEVFKEDLRMTKGPRHGGNYRSEKLVEDLDERAEDEEEKTPRLHGGNLQAAHSDPEGDGGANEKRNAHTARRSAALLNTLAQAATVLTTTPKFILDPSKRMYYYVDT